MPAPTNSPPLDPTPDGPLPDGLLLDGLLLDGLLLDGPLPFDGWAEVEDADGRLVDDAALAQIEELDDTIFSALRGDATALDRVAHLWDRIKESAPAALVDESREQYIRRALAIAEEYELNPASTLGRHFASLEVLGLLAN